MQGGPFAVRTSWLSKRCWYVGFPGLTGKPADTWFIMQGVPQSLKTVLMCQQRASGYAKSFCRSLKKKVKNGQVMHDKSAILDSTNVNGLAYCAKLGFLDTAYVTSSCEALAKTINQVKIEFLEQTLCLMTNIDCGGKRCVMRLQPKCLGLPKCSVLA